VLSFAISPFVRAMRQFGLGHTSAVLAAVATTGLVVLMLAGVIASQAIQMASKFPEYQGTFKANVQSLRALTLSRLESTFADAERMLDPQFGEDAGRASARPTGQAAPDAALPVEIRKPRASPTEVLQRVLGWVWGPIGTTGIVLVVLVFVLLDQEALRDRFIRLVGGADLRTTTTAINDAGERLSRYLMRQFAVNASVGLVIWIALSAIGLPHATLVATLTAVLRFVPFLGVPIAAFLAAGLALAAAPGWGTMLLTLATFMSVQLVTSQVIEPRLYGHATGLSPLSIVLATLFWGWLWGPIGVIIATPLTLCLAVAGRHAQSLGFLDIVLGDGPALTMAQKFYQRALSGDSEEIIGGAREFLKRRPFAAYCDTVLMPALLLGRADVTSGEITPHQQAELRSAIVRVVEALDGVVSPKRMFGRRKASVLEDASPGRLLRQQRIARQRSEALRSAPADGTPAPVRPLVLCIGLGSLGDDLATELLVRILRGLQIDARHLMLEDLHAGPPPEMPLSDISAMCIVSATPHERREHAAEAASRIRAKLPQAYLLALQFPSVLAEIDRPALTDAVDRVATSFEDAALEVSERVLP
jgi:predicted PurR-regulated permease PerM